MTSNSKIISDLIGFYTHMVVLIVAGSGHLTAQESTTVSRWAFDAHEGALCRDWLVEEWTFDDNSRLVKHFLTKRSGFDTLSSTLINYKTDSIEILCRSSPLTKYTRDMVPNHQWEEYHVCGIGLAGSTLRLLGKQHFTTELQPIFAFADDTVKVGHCLLLNAYLVDIQTLGGLLSRDKTAKVKVLAENNTRYVHITMSIVPTILVEYGVPIYEVFKKATLVIQNGVLVREEYVTNNHQFQRKYYYTEGNRSPTLITSELKDAKGGLLSLIVDRMCYRYSW